MVSQKQMLANQQNALKSTGPKTAQGKALAKRNSLRHGLLAKEVVITEGDGAEDQQAFDTLMTDLVEQFEPAGSLEEILVEKIAVCYWRLRRANQYEVGVLRQKLDTVTDDYYEQESYGGTRLHKTDDEIDMEIEEIQEALNYMKKAKTKLSVLWTKGASLEETYDDDEMWERVEINRYDLLIDLED